MKPLSPRLFDLSAIGLSGLCLVHCLALPVLAAILPVFGSWARAEWVHAVFIAIAAPLSAGALWLNSRGERRPMGLYIAALAGLALLALGAGGWPKPALETPITVAGSLTPGQRAPVELAPSPPPPLPCGHGGVRGAGDPARRSRLSAGSKRKTGIPSFASRSKCPW